MRESQQDVASSADRKPGNGCSGGLMLIVIAVGVLAVTSGGCQDAENPSIPLEAVPPTLMAKELPSDWRERIDQALVGYESLVKSDRRFEGFDPKFEQIEKSFPVGVRVRLSAYRTCLMQMNDWREAGRTFDTPQERELFFMVMEEYQEHLERLAELQHQGYVERRNGVYFATIRQEPSKVDPPVTRESVIRSNTVDPTIPDQNDIESQANGKLKLAQRYIKINRPEKARELLDQLTNEFSDTKAGKLAIEEMKKLR